MDAVILDHFLFLFFGTIYVVTGKLGGGKTLMSVSLIKKRLEAGCLVATNLDINLRQMFGRKTKNCKLYRVPDRPKIEDLESIGNANKSYDESKNGLLVLDECATWFNSRSWNDEGRKEVNEWLIHSRKHGWDVILIIQNISVLDKQARVQLAEHVVYCKRTDRLKIPFIGWIIKLIFGGRLPLPKIHIGVVKYGDQPTSTTVDTWFLAGIDLYSSYDTKQIFVNDKEASTYLVENPYYTHFLKEIPRITLKQKWRYSMFLTKIYYRKYSRFLSFAAGSVCMAGFASFTANADPAFENQPETDAIIIAKSDEGIFSRSPQGELEEDRILSKLVLPSDLMVPGWRITGYFSDGETRPKYFYSDQEGRKFDSYRLANDYRIIARSPCESLLVDLKDKTNFRSIFCD